jgi:hypothetical protein
MEKKFSEAMVRSWGFQECTAVNPGNTVGVEVVWGREQID